jgi:hypothetical protein
MKKRIVVLVLLIAVAAGTAFARKVRYTGNGEDSMGSREYDSAYVVGWERVGGPPPNSSTASTSGCIIDRNGNRRHPRMEIRGSGNDLIDNGAMKVVAISGIDSIYDRVYFVATRAANIFPPRLVAETRLYIVEPGGKVFFAKNNGKTNGQLEGRYVHVGGTIYEDTDFKIASNFREVMDMYAMSVPTDWLKKGVENSRKFYKTDDELADKMISSYADLSGGWGSLVGLGPAFLMPAELGANMVQNMMKAHLAYALSVIYRNESAGDALRDDLVIFFAGDNVDITIKQLLVDTGKAGAQNVAEDLTKAGLKKLGVKVFANTKLANTAASKMAMKGVEKGIPVLGVVIGAYGNYNDVKNFGEQAKKYYRAK